MYLNYKASVYVAFVRLVIYFVVSDMKRSLLWNSEQRSDKQTSDFWFKENTLDEIT